MVMRSQWWCEIYGCAGAKVRLGGSVTLSSLSLSLSLSLYVSNPEMVYSENRNVKSFSGQSLFLHDQLRVRLVAGNANFWKRKCFPLFGCLGNHFPENQFRCLVRPNILRKLFYGKSIPVFDSSKHFTENTLRKSFYEKSLPVFGL